MLVLPGRNRRKFRQRPRQWGPVSAVRANILRQCDAMGLPPPYLLFPFWEGGGKDPVNYGLYHTRFMGNRVDCIQDGLAIYEAVSAASYASAPAPFYLNGEVSLGVISTHLSGAIASQLCHVLSDRPSDAASNITFELRTAATHDGSSKCMHFAYRTSGTWHIWDRRYMTYDLNEVHHFSFSFKYGQGSSILAFYDGTDQTSLGAWRLGNGNTVPAAGGSSWFVGFPYAYPYTDVAATFHFAYLFLERFTAEQWALFHDQPYRLLWPAPVPIFIDLGGQAFYSAVGGGTVGLGGTLARSTMRGVGAGIVGPVGDVVKRMARAVGAGIVSLAGAVSGVLAATALAQLKPKWLSGNAQFTPCWWEGVAVGAGVVGPVGHVVKQVARTVGGGTVGLGGIVDRTIAVVRLVGGGAVGLVGSLTRLTGLSVGKGSLSLEGTVDKAVIVALLVGGGVVGSLGALARRIGFGVGKGSLGLGGTLSRSTMRGVGGGSVSPAGFVSPVLKILADVGGGTLSLVGALIAGLIASISVGSGLLGPVGALVKQVGRSVGAGIVGPVGNAVKRAAWTVGAGVIGLAGAVRSVLNPEIPVGSWAGKVFGGGLKKIIGGRRRRQ